MRDFLVTALGDGSPRDVHVAPSLHHAGAVFVQVGDFSDHLTKDEALKIAASIRDAADQVRDVVTYRGVVVPNGQHVNGRVDGSFQAGVDAALATAEGTPGKCGAVRQDGRWSEFPCVRLPGHDGPHVDRDEDDFE